MPLTDPVTIRPGIVDDALGIAIVHIACQQAAYRDIFPSHLLKASDLSAVEASKREILLADEAGDICTFVAENEAWNIIGYATGGPCRNEMPDFDGELYNVFVLPAYQGRGIGSQLFLHIVNFLLDKGDISLSLWVVKGTNAVAYYEHLGGQITAERHETVSGYPLDLACYHWRNLDALRAKLAQREINS